MVQQRKLTVVYLLHSLRDNAYVQIDMQRTKTKSTKTRHPSRNTENLVEKKKKKKWLTN